MMRTLFVTLFILTLTVFLPAQEIGHWDSNMHQMDREDMELALSEQYFPGMWPENRAVPMQTRHFRNEGNKLFRHFYRTKLDLFATQKNGLYLKANPVASFAMGGTRKTNSPLSKIPGG